MTQPDPFGQADDFFSGGSPSISFKGDHNLNVPKGGVIQSIGDRQQATDYNTKKPKTWDNDGSPIMVLPIRLQTEERDPTDPHDDGIRTLWIEEGTALKRAVGDALRTTRSKLRPSGTLHVAWVGGKGETGDPKLYQAQYIPGAPAADAMFTQPAAPAAPAAPAWPAQAQQPAAPAAPAPDLWAQQAAASTFQPAAPAAAPQWPGQPAAPAAPLAAVPQQPAAPAPAPGGFDPAAIDAAYAHLNEGQRTAIKMSMQQGMTAEQVVGVFGPPQGAAA